MTRPWRLSFILASAQFFFAGFYFAITGPISPKIEIEWGLSPAALGWLGSVLFYAYALVQIPAGTLADTFGSRRMFVVAGVLTALGAGLFGAAPSLGVAIIGRLLLGLGTGLLLTSGFRQISTVTSGRPSEAERFITFFGIFTTANYLGFALGATPLVLAVAAFGWRAPLLAAAAISGVLAFATWVTPETPEKTGQGGRRQLRAAFATWRSERTIWAYALIRFLYGSFIGFQTLWAVPLLLITFGFSFETVGLVLLATALGQAVGPTLGAGLNRRSGRTRRLVFGAGSLYAAACMTILVLSRGQSPRVFVFAAFTLVGLAQTMTVIGYGLVSARVPPEQQSTVAGMVNVAPWIGSAVFQFGAGFLVEGLLSRPGAVSSSAAYAAALVPLSIIGLTALPLIWLLDAGRAGRSAH